MPSPHVIQILRSKTRLSDEEIIKLTDSQAWKAIYEAEKEERDRRELLRKPEVCFTGFNYEERENLETDAVIKGLKVRKRVTVDLGYLVIGDTPGEKKIELALEQGVEILSLEEYEKKEFFVKKPKLKTKKRKKDYEEEVYDEIYLNDPNIESDNESEDEIILFEKKVEISITEDKEQEKEEEKAKVEYLSPSQTASRNGNYVTIKNNFVSSKNKKSDSSFPFYFLRVLAGRLWIFISVTTFVFNFGQVFLCSKFEPIGFLFLIFTYCLSVWAVNADKSNNREPSFSYFLIPRGKLNKIIFYTALSLAILSIIGAASDINLYCQ